MIADQQYAETDDLGFEVPKIYWNFTSENVMTLDWIDGVSIRETEELKKRNLDTNKIAEDIIQHFLRHAVRDGFFHADMHQGNIFIDNNGTLFTQQCAETYQQRPCIFEYVYFSYFNTSQINVSVEIPTPKASIMKAKNI